MSVQRTITDIGFDQTLISEFVGYLMLNSRSTLFSKLKEPITKINRTILFLFSLLLISYPALEVSVNCLNVKASD